MAQGRTVKVKLLRHCPGNIALMISDEKICFVGDALSMEVLGGRICRAEIFPS